MKERERTRWRCRRGMLELDVILQRFIDKYYGQLNEEELRQFEVLLDLPDNDLWDMIALKKTEDKDVQSALRLLQTA